MTMVMSKITFLPLRFLQVIITMKGIHPKREEMIVDTTLYRYVLYCLIFQCVTKYGQISAVAAINTVVQIEPGRTYVHRVYLCCYKILARLIKIHFRCLLCLINYYPLDIQSRAINFFNFYFQNWNAPTYKRLFFVPIRENNRNIILIPMRVRINIIYLYLPFNIIYIYPTLKLNHIKYSEHATKEERLTIFFGQLDYLGEINENT